MWVGVSGGGGGDNESVSAWLLTPGRHNLVAGLLGPRNTSSVVRGNVGRHHGGTAHTFMPPVDSITVIQATRNAAGVAGPGGKNGLRYAGGRPAAGRRRRHHTPLAAAQHASCGHTYQ